MAQKQRDTEKQLADVSKQLAEAGLKLDIFKEQVRKHMLHDPNGMIHHPLMFV